MDATGLDGKRLQMLLDSGSLLQTLEQEDANIGALDSTYWLCFLAVNQHRSICGTALNPCSCGCEHFPSGHPSCEVDKFEQVMSMMPRGMVVSLGPDLGALKRIWCLAEISTALHMDRPIEFSLSPGMPAEMKTAIAAGQYVAPQVQGCEASDPADIARILQNIESTLGFDRFNQEIGTVLVMQGPGVTGYSSWRGSQPPARWQELQARFNELPEEEKHIWRARDIASFDRAKFRDALSNPNRYEFTYFSNVTKMTIRVVGLPASWEDLKIKLNKGIPLEFDGEMLSGMAVHETIGPGPKVFGVVGDRVYYHDAGVWNQYISCTPIAIRS
ncbi:unnamed protein product [Polarella glacialis]|uniref:Uncharacterized protein n=1 Tax=Polarella glacialis TaxID=89957 RepID=A0A813FVE9_POLGL|nr:unnamed protein product [Polarella glacialis]CAE8616484.1 unnamed protein product [Polarella glacialis]CAE8652191.1 unnamed protein product [Polarella glacialis]CAE8741953.1 unnamed protein product [Polarella glacialis]